MRRVEWKESSFWNRLGCRLAAVGIIVIVGIFVAGCVPDHGTVYEPFPGQKDVGDVVSSAEISEAVDVSGSVEVHFIDVGQGDATLINADGHYMLIDAGDNSKGTVVQFYLQKQGVDKLDYLILTHTDADHIGGADVIITKFGIDNIFIGDYEKDNQTYNDVMDAIEYKNLSYSTPAVGTEFQLGNAVFTILAPNGSYEDANNSSIALLLTHGDNSFLFSGDCEEAAENDILLNETDVDCDVYKVAHHGSSKASSQRFLDAMTPEYAVISCGEDNDYGHPHKEIMHKLQDMNVEIYRTDEQGSIVAFSDGKEITWNYGGEQEGEVTYICNTNSYKFHYANCSSVEDMQEHNKLPVAWTREEVIAIGYSPCGGCKP